MSDRDDMILFLVACFVCFVVGVIVGSVFTTRVEECGTPVFHVVEGCNASLFGLGNLTVMESGGILVVENLSMLEAFGGG